MLKCLPPVGHPIVLTSSKNPEKVLQTVFGDSPVFLYGSGTMALAASLLAIKELHGIASPEVILPAYACPDLISAALFAGIKPVLVDLEHDTPWMDLEKLKERIGRNTIAVIATHFLGITERMSEIRTLLSDSDVVLIEDSAQLFPKIPSEDVWQGDLVVLSFGRGKPVSLLGGGAVICKEKSMQSHLPLAGNAVLIPDTDPPSLKFLFKAALYNRLLSPIWYARLTSLPFLHLGETRYKPLADLETARRGFIATLAANIEAYTSRNLKPQLGISSMLAEVSSEAITDLPSATMNNPALPLLRYPILLKTPALRDRLFASLKKSGLGVSIMYPAPLNGIDGLKDVLQNQGLFPEATGFSQRLLTLPCHDGVTSNHIDQIGCVLNELLCA